MPSQSAGSSTVFAGRCLDGQYPRTNSSCGSAIWGLTFDMSGGPKGAKRPLERPLDGGVRRHCLHTRTECKASLFTTALIAVTSGPHSSMNSDSQRPMVRATFGA